jgi:pilus assembly protein Flp/PilA
MLARFVRDESGATSVEYGLIAVCISVAIVVVLQGVGDKVKDTLIAADLE